MQFPRHDWQDAVYNERAACQLSIALGLPRPAAALLAARGLEGIDQARRFLTPRLADLSDPLAMADVPVAAERVITALDQHEPIIVFADFDADGVSAAAVLGGVLSRLGADVRVFHPERIAEGYGLSPRAVDRCLTGMNGARLLITVDCGIQAHQEIARLQAHGCTVIVTDHHEPGETLPPALAVINPWRDPDPDIAGLAGVGVAFKFCHAIVKRLRQRADPRAVNLDLRDWLDIVAVGTIADVVPLQGENRTLVYAGLQRLIKQPSPGLRALIRRAGLHPPHIGSQELSFVLGPRLNAAGRIDRAETASALLMTADADQAARHAALLEHLNARRRSIERTMLVEALRQIEAFNPLRDGAVTVAAPGWHPGAIGIVAARLADRFQTPAAVIALAPDGTGRGSIRTAGDVNLLQALQACNAWTERAGGHRSAAGLSLKAGCLDAFRAAFGDACRAQCNQPAARSSLHIDAWLTPADIEEPLMHALRRLEPFGDGHAHPCWALAGLEIDGAPRRIGQNGAHLRLNLRRPGEPPLEAIGFHFGDCELPTGRLDVAFTLSRNRWQGANRIQLRLCDLRPAQVP